MPRITYRNKDGEKLPSVTTVLSRFKASGALIHWAWKLGIDGKDYRTVSTDAASIGTYVHKLIEDGYKGPLDINSIREETSCKFSQAEPIQQCLSGYRDWKQKVNFRVTQREISLVSEKYGFGGTFDGCVILKRRSLLDYKTSKAIYLDYVIQLAAYGLLWKENFPNKSISGGYHIVRFGKEDGEFETWSASETKMKPAAEMFLSLLKAYKLEAKVKELL